MIFRRNGDSETSRSILELIQELLGHTVQLLDQQLMLLRLEIEHSVGTLVRHVAILVVGGVITALGLVFASIALALWVGSHLGSAALGFAVMGAAVLVAGAALVAARLRRGVGPRRLFPERTMKELEKDTRWLKSDL